MQIKKRKINNQSGAAMLISVVFFLFISLAIIGGLVTPSVRSFKNASVNLNSKQSYFLAESGGEDAVYRVLNNIALGSSEVITLGSNSVTTTITDDLGQKDVVSTGDVSNHQRKTDIKLFTMPGVAFNYGIQVGPGGMKIDGGSRVTGNVYSNGNIQANSGVVITGSAIAAGATSYVGDGDGVSPNPYMGTVVIGSGGVGDAWAYRVVGGNVSGNLYCQIGTLNNKSCNTSHGIPPAQPLPFTDQNITDWKTTAAAGGIITGATKCPGGYSGGNCIVGWQNATFGPGKITGNLTVNGGGTLTLTGTVWVVGTITVTSGAKIKLPLNYGLNSETMISDSYVTLNGGSYTGSGTSGSYLFVVSTSDCPISAYCAGKKAITVSGGSGAVAVAAQNGTVSLSGGAGVSAAVGDTTTVTGGFNVTYDQGLASPSFVNGPSGAWLVQTWKETE